MTTLRCFGDIRFQRSYAPNARPSAPVRRASFAITASSHSRAVSVASADLGSFAVSLLQKRFTIRRHEPGPHDGGSYAGGDPLDLLEDHRRPPRAQAAQLRPRW